MIGISQEEFFGAATPAATPAAAPGTALAPVSQEQFFSTGQQDQPSAEPQSPGFVERFSEDLDSRRQMLDVIKDATENGEQSFAEGLFQTAGKVGAGTVLDFIGEGVKSAVHGISAITPDAIEGPIVDFAKTAGGAFLETEIGQAGLNAAKEGMEAWENFKRANPRAARNIESVVNIGVLAAPVKAKPKTGPTPLATAANKVDKVRVNQVKGRREDFATELVMPKQTAAVRTDQVSRTTETGAGVLNRKQVQPSAQEVELAREVFKVPGISRSKTLQANYNTISSAVEREATKLKSRLSNADVKFERSDYMEELGRAMTRLRENPLIVGDAEKTAKKIVTKMQQIIEGKASTASALLQARKELDSWMRSQKGDKIFDPKQENALSIALREIRQTTNDFIDARASDVGVKTSLARQSKLLRAMDNIAPKAAEEASSAVLRAWQTVTRLLPLRGEFNQSMAAVVGIGGLGASAIFAPFFTGIAGATLGAYGAGRLITAPGTKKALSSLLSNVDKAIRATNDADLIRQLRADRAIIVEIIKTAEERRAEQKTDEQQQ